MEGLRRVYETLKRNSDALLQTNLGLRRTLEQLSQRKASLLHEVYLEANAIAQLTGRPRLFPALVESRHVPLLAAPAPAPAPLPSTTTFIHTHADTKTVLSTHTEQLTVLVQRLRASAGQDPALLSLLNSILVNLENIRGSLNPASNGTEDVSRLLERNRQLTLDATRTDTRLRELLVKYSRAESMRKALIYQKKYLLLLLGGFQESEEVTLSMIASMGVSPTVAVRPRFLALRAKLRAAIVCAQAATRLRLLVRRRVARHGTR